MASIIQRKSKLEKKIKDLEKNQMFEIYRILEENDYPYTKNKNGIFFNLTDMDTNLFKILENYVNYSVQNNILLKKMERKIEKLSNELTK